MEKLCWSVVIYVLNAIIQCHFQNIVNAVVVIEDGVLNAITQAISRMSMQSHSPVALSANTPRRLSTGHVLNCTPCCVIGKMCFNSTFWLYWPTESDVYPQNMVQSLNAEHFAPPCGFPSHRCKRALAFVPLEGLEITISYPPPCYFVPKKCGCPPPSPSKNYHCQRG